MPEKSLAEILCIILHAISPVGAHSPWHKSKTKDLYTVRNKFKKCNVILTRKRPILGEQVTCTFACGRSMQLTCFNLHAISTHYKIVHFFHCLHTYIHTHNYTTAYWYDHETNFILTMAHQGICCQHLKLTVLLSSCFCLPPIWKANNR